jgi:hypothetical protein
MGAHQRGREGEGEGKRGVGVAGALGGHGEGLLLEDGWALHCCSEPLCSRENCPT